MTADDIYFTTCTWNAVHEFIEACLVTLWATQTSDVFQEEIDGETQSKNPYVWDWITYCHYITQPKVLL